jgi:hypothetical protein
LLKGMHTPVDRRVPPTQPKPWFSRLCSNADVSEVIAEYACGAVKDACALRAANKGYRRAVDTTVRRWVYEDQPDLRPSSEVAHSGGREALTLSGPSGCQLDGALVAFTCDRYCLIARLIVVAFALDGAKDELHEAGACGQRPIECGDRPNAALVDTATAPPSTLFPAPPAVQTAISRCLANALIDRASLPAVAQLCLSPCWPFLTDLHLAWAEPRKGFGGLPRAQAESHPINAPSRPAAAGEDDASAPSDVVTILQALGPQLLRLTLDLATANICPGIAACRSLIQFTVPLPSSPVAPAAVCDALITSGAPLTSVEAKLDPAAAVRLLEAVPTLVRLTSPGVAPISLPACVAARMHTLNHSRMPASDTLVVLAARDWAPSERLQHLVVSGDDPLPLHTLHTAFPQLQTMWWLSGRLQPAFANDDLDADSGVRFPPTLRSLSLGTQVPAPHATPLLHQMLAQHCNGLLPMLNQLIVDNFDISVVDLRPLARCASSTSLTRLTLSDPDGALSWTADEVAQVEAVLSRLVGLTELFVLRLPTPRCLLAGRHAQLRKLTVRALDVPTKDILFADVVNACPRLMQASSTSPGEPFAVPSGWAIRTYSLISVTRVSMA